VRTAAGIVMFIGFAGVFASIPVIVRDIWKDDMDRSVFIRFMVTAAVLYFCGLLTWRALA
jgi:hypothetical protein